LTFKELEAIDRKIPLMFAGGTTNGSYPHFHS